MPENTIYPDFSKLLNFLKQPGSYDHPVDDVKHIQTHISHVFLAGDFVYKLKKPVDLGFLDYSTLQKRKKYCFHEVELNRRLSDDIYLGVIGFIKHDDLFVLEEDNLNSNEIIEFAVKMRKLQDEYFVHQIIKNDELPHEHLDRIVDTLSAFYLDQKQDQEQNSELSNWGEIDKIKVNTDENFEQTEQFIDQTIERISYEAIKQFTNQYFKQNRSLFHRRVEDRRIVDGHGDLHLEHIHISPEKVQIYDCIEFNDRFRYGDLAADLAYLAMDLDFNHCKKEERYFVDQMSKKLNDEDLLQIIDFYKCYRAYVKGKVKSIHSAEEEVTKKDRDVSTELALKYFKLSLRYALIGSDLVVIIFMGRVGTGKSTLAKLLADQLNIEQYSSDTIRKTLAGLPLTERTPPFRRKFLYSEEMSAKTYNRLTNQALNSINQGKSVILDATFSKQTVRQSLIDKLNKENASYLFVETKASDDIIVNRLQKRAAKNDVISDARFEDFEKLTDSYESPAEPENECFITVNTDQSPEDSLQELFKKMIDLNIVVQ